MAIFKRLPKPLLLLTFVIVLSQIGCGGGATEKTASSKTVSPETMSSKPAQSLTLNSAVAASKDQATQEISIAAASDLRFALEEVIAEFQRQHPHIRCQAQYGSSGNFFAQISNKAPFDVYLSADIEYPRKLVEQGLAIRDSQFSYAIGHLVVWVPNDSPITVEKSGIQALLDPTVKKVAIANPKHAPYGRAAEAAMKSLGVYDQVEKQLVLADNIAQTAQWLESGNADIGLIALSLAVSPKMKEKGRYWPVPESSHPVLEQGGVILESSQVQDAAMQLRSFMISTDGRKILTSYGFAEPRQ